MMDDKIQDSDVGMVFCQSCGMPMGPKDFGTNADNTANEDYCCYCYKEGKFVGPENCTMEQMIDFCAQFTDEMNKHAGTNYSPEEYKRKMRAYFPRLKRWQKA